MNNDHYSRGSSWQNQQQHQPSGYYHSSQSQLESSDGGAQHEVRGISRHDGVAQPQHMQCNNQQALPPGWIEVTDPSSGKLYYCNPQTRETKWERPTMTITTALAPQRPGNSMATIENLASHQKVPLNQLKSQHQHELQQQKDLLPRGWIEAKDANSGKVYYCNPKTRETSWERPASSTLAVSTTRQGRAGVINSPLRGPGFTGHNTVDDSGINFDANRAPSKITQSMPSSTMGKRTGANINDDNEIEVDDDGDFDELKSFTTGQIAHLIRLQKRQQSAQQLAQSDEERQVQLSTIVSSKSSKDSNEKKTGSSQELSNYVPIDLSLMSSLPSNERTEPGRLDVRMYALREELKKFGSSQSSKQAAHIR